MLPFSCRIPVGDADTDFLNGTFIPPVSCLACQQAYITGAAWVIHTHPIERYLKCRVIYLFYRSADATDCRRCICVFVRQFGSQGIRTYGFQMESNSIGFRIEARLYTYMLFLVVCQQTAALFKSQILFFLTATLHIPCFSRFCHFTVKIPESVMHIAFIL